MKLERRFIDAGELRVKGSGDGRKIGGYATKFGVLSEDLGYFREEIAASAFDACLMSVPDVRCLWNHDANHILGRTKAGTLRLSTDKVGLVYEVDPPATNLAKDLMISMERGDVTQSSFGFICVEDTWRDDPNTGGFIRTVLKAELFDVSPVTYPAYPDATSGVRSVRSLFPDGDEQLQAKVAELRAAKEARSKEAEVLVETPAVTVEAVVPDPALVVAEQRSVDNSVDANDGADTSDDPNSGNLWEDDDSEDYRCAYRCQACSSIGHYPSAVAEDDPTARSLRKKSSGAEDMDNENKRCAYRCAGCAKHSYPTAVAEDDPIARASATEVEAAAQSALEAEQRATEELETLQLRVALKLKQIKKV
jgi:uncharacterized protein